MSRRLLAGWRRLAALALCLAVATAQDPQPTRPATRPATDRQNPEQALEGVEVRRIVVTPPEAQTAGVIVTKLKTQVGRPFRRAVMAEDLAALWSTLKVRAGFEAELTSEGVQVTILIHLESPSNDREEAPAMDEMGGRVERTERSDTPKTQAAPKPQKSPSGREAGAKDPSGSRDAEVEALRKELETLRAEMRELRELLRSRGDERRR